MVTSKAKTVREYLAELPEDRRKAIEAVRETIRANLDPKFEEGMQYGMIGYYLPHSVYPAGYHCDPKQPLPYAGLASQKNHMSVYLFCIYSDEGDATEFQKAWKATGKKLDMGKGCVRFKKLEDVPLEVLGDAIRRATADRFVAMYEANLARGRSGERRASTKKAVRKSAKKSASKASVSKKRAGAAAAPPVRKAAKKAAKKASRKAGKKVRRRIAH